MPTASLLSPVIPIISSESLPLHDDQEKHVHEQTHLSFSAVLFCSSTTTGKLNFRSARTSLSLSSCQPLFPQFLQIILRAYTPLIQTTAKIGNFYVLFGWTCQPLLLLLLHILKMNKIPSGRKKRYRIMQNGMARAHVTTNPDYSRD